ncbi:unnamed protein product [Lathyrus oleraceus]|uniref:DUF4378 domain-containing protein n=1 Tax=Pisum sativum TaxID=3888 RepID=A0A9D5AAJ1_PEA|nr:uncharacterized protein LOC127087983 [Pisum sativum]KAI5404137.1 hypothetical protein KIW84_051325 [Pisum sativum]
MASPSPKPQKKLSEFLNEQQEPFILELYLLERSNSSKTLTSTSTKNFEKPTISCFLNKKRKPFFPFCKILTCVHKKKLAAAIKNSHTTNKHTNAGVTITHEANNVDRTQTAIETDRFSTASSSTVFHSCSDIDDEEDRTSFSSHNYHNPLFSSDSGCNIEIQSQQDTDNRKCHQRCIKVCVTHETLNKDVCVCGVAVPRKITEESLLSAAIFSSLIQTAKKDQKNYTKQLRQILEHKRVLYKTKKLLFDCVKEFTKNMKKKDRKKLMGGEKLGMIIWKRRKEGGGNYETNITNLLDLDYLESINEWSEFKTEMKDISIEIADAILERVMKDEIDILPPTTQQT